MNKRKTVGQESVDRLLQRDFTQTVRDTQVEVQRNYFDEIRKTIEQVPDWTEPFYISVLTRKDKLLENVVRFVYIPRQTLPTPHWDQTVWRYNPVSEDIEYIWTIPDKISANEMLQFPHEVKREEYQLFEFVKLHAAGMLYPKMLLKHEKDELANMRKYGDLYEGQEKKAKKDAEQELNSKIE